MISSKLNGRLLLAGIIAYVLMMLSWAMQGNQDTTLETIAWASASEDWQNVGMIRMLAMMSMLVFLAGYSAWLKSINEASTALSIGAYFALFGIILMWVGLITGITGFDLSKNNADAAAALIELSGTGFWFGGTCMGISFLLVGLSVFRQKIGNPTLMVILAVLGLSALVGNFVMWQVWLGSFGLGLLLLAYIGITNKSNN